jgi:hypothetical protein
VDRISWNNYKKYLDSNWSFVETDITSRMAIQRKYYWNSFVYLFTNKLMEDYYFSGIYNFLRSYKKFIKLRQKLNFLGIC